MKIKFQNFTFLPLIQGMQLVWFFGNRLWFWGLVYLLIHFVFLYFLGPFRMFIAQAILGLPFAIIGRSYSRKSGKWSSDDQFINRQHSIRKWSITIFMALLLISFVRVLLMDNALRNEIKSTQEQVNMLEIRKNERLRELKKQN